MEQEYMEQEYEEWMWEQILEEGPPQDDDITWIKHEIVGVVLREIRDAGPHTVPDVAEYDAEASARRIKAKIAGL